VADEPVYARVGVPPGIEVRHEDYDDGDDKILFRAEDTETLASALEQLSTDLIGQAHTIRQHRRMRG
jgi:hypothetical protein